MFYIWVKILTAGEHRGKERSRKIT